MARGNNVEIAALDARTTRIEERLEGLTSIKTKANKNMERLSAQTKEIIDHLSAQMKESLDQLSAQLADV